MSAAQIRGQPHDVEIGRDVRRHCGRGKGRGEHQADPQLRPDGSQLRRRPPHREDALGHSSGAITGDDHEHAGRESETLRGRRGGRIRREPDVCACPRQPLDQPRIDASVSRKHQVHAGKGDTRPERRLGSCAVDQERHARGARRSYVLCIRRQCEEAQRQDCGSGCRPKAASQQRHDTSGYNLRAGTWAPHVVARSHGGHRNQKRYSKLPCHWTRSDTERKIARYAHAPPALRGTAAGNSMKCLAVCQDELIIRVLDEILLPSFEVEFLVENKALAKRLSDDGVHITAGDLKRTDTYIKTNLTPNTCIIVEDNGRRSLRKALEALRDAGGTLIYVLGVGTGEADKREDELKALFPDIVVPDDGGAVRRAASHRVQPITDARARAAVPAVLQRRGPCADPPASRSRSRRDGQRPRRAQPAPPHEDDGNHRRHAGGDASRESADGEPARHPRGDDHGRRPEDVRPRRSRRRPAPLLQRPRRSRGSRHRPSSRDHGLERDVQGHPRPTTARPARS